MTTYEDMTEKVFATGVIPDGYNGKTADVKFALDGHTVYIVTKTGYFRSHFVGMADIPDALWTMTHHPQIRNYVSHLQAV